MKRRKYSSGTGLSTGMANVLLAGDNAIASQVEDRSADADASWWLFNAQASAAQKKWTNVAIVSVNNLAVHGVRTLLRTLCPLRVQIFDNVKSLQYSLFTAKSFHPDIIIWIDARIQNLEGMAPLAIHISRKLPAVRQLALSESIPQTLAILPRGAQVAPLNTPICELTDILKSCLQPQARGGKLFRGRFMTPGQWRIIRLLTDGLSVKQVAEISGISPKTVWGREEEVMRRLNVQGHVQKAWFYRSIVEVLSVMPGLGRPRRERGS